MNLFVYTSLNDAQRVYLRNQIPSSVKPIFRDELPAAEWPAAFGAAEILMGNPSAEWFNQAPNNLTFWQLDSAGFDQYRELRVNATVANMGDFFARPCAETMLAGILAFYRGLDKLVKAQTQKKMAIQRSKGQPGFIRK